MKLLTIIGAALAAMLSVSAAEAATGWATADVALWRNPLTHSGRLTVVPAGARVQVFRCLDFCEVVYGRYHGWADGAAIEVSEGRFRSMFMSPVVREPSGDVALVPVYVPPQVAYVASSSLDWCGSWHCRQQPYDSWYTGKILYFQGRFADRPDGAIVVGR